MIPPITLIVADDMTQGNAIIKKCNLNPDSCAVINKPEYFSHIDIKDNETIYVNATISLALLGGLTNKANSDEVKPKIKIVQI